MCFSGCPIPSTETKLWTSIGILDPAMFDRVISRLAIEANPNQIIAKDFNSDDEDRATISHRCVAKVSSII